VESAAGVAEGGRTGLTTLIVAVLFILSLFLAPLFLMVPASATAPVLILVGTFMMEPVKNIPFADYTESIPAFLTMVMMPFTYSIAEGIAFGMISYVILKALSGKHKEVSLVMYILAALFMLKFFV
jgi:AGZA family xanthine/uracil permease-like MFS transporter